MDKENCYQVMKLVPQAIDGDARAAAMLWRELAANASDANDNDIRRWIQHVALRLVDNVIDSKDPPNRKAEAARRAVGLSGQIGNGELRQYIAEMDDCLKDFKCLDKEGNEIPGDETAPGWAEHIQMAKTVIDCGIVKPAPSGKEASDYIQDIAKRIERIRQGLAE